jgi:hypothetical protein
MDQDLLQHGVLQISYAVWCGLGSWAVRDEGNFSLHPPHEEGKEFSGSEV